MKITNIPRSANYISKVSSIVTDRLVTYTILTYMAYTTTYFSARPFYILVKAVFINWAMLKFLYNFKHSMMIFKTVTYRNIESVGTHYLQCSLTDRPTIQVSHKLNAHWCGKSSQKFIWEIMFFRPTEGI